MSKFKMYEVVIASKPLENVSMGTKGTVLIVFEDMLHYEVEFVDDNGNSLSIMTVSEDELQKISG